MPFKQNAEVTQVNSNIPMGFKSPDGMSSMAGMLDVGAKMLSLQKAQQTFDSDVAKSKAESSSAESGATVAAANVGNLIKQQSAVTSKAETGANKEAFDLQQHKVQTARQAIMELTQNKNLQNQDPNTYDKNKAVSDIAKVRQYMIANGHDEASTESLAARLMGEAGTAGGVMNMLHGQILSGTPSGATAQTISPNIKSTNLNNGVVNQDTSIFSGTTSPNLTGTMTGGVAPGTSLPNALGQPGLTGPSPITPAQLGGPPSAPNRQPPASGFNANKGDALVGNVPTQPGTPPATPEQEARARMVSDIAGLKREMGRAPDATAKQIISNELSRKESLLSQNDARPTPGYITGGMPTGQAENIKDNVEAMNTHFAKLSGPASDAQLALSLTSSIKTLARDAITGTTSGRQSYVNGLLNSFKLGNQVTGDLQKDTDLLEKYLAQLNLTTPAASDAARTLISAARPHGTMKDTAIIEAADQISSVINANLAVRNHLAKWKYKNDGKGDSVGYQAEREKVEALADPRIWQMQGKTKAEQTAFIDALKSPALASELVRKARALHDMGVTK